MRGPLTLAVAQPLILPHAVGLNAERHAASVRAARSRLIVFPEMSLTGYEFDADPLDPGDERLLAIVEACRAMQAITLAGAPVVGPGGGKSIGMFRIDKDGVSIAYRKMWLGSAEQAVFEPGDRPAVFEIDGWRVGLAICKDTGVPQHAAATAGSGLDLYVAAVLEHGTDRGVQPARAQRTIADHGVWVAMASFAGSTGEGYDQTAGESTVWRPDGSVATRAGSEPDEYARFTLS